MAVSYDPIIEIRDLRRIRVFDPVSSPSMGTALVLEGAGRDPLVVNSGERVPEARIGNYRRAFLVDLGQYGLQLEENLPSSDRSFVHQCSITFSCRVLNPALVVERGIRDVAEAVRIPIVRILRAVARKYDISQSNEAEAALNDAFETIVGDVALSLTNHLVEVAVPGDRALRSSEEFHDTRRDARLDAMRRGEMRDVLAGGREELIAQWLAKHAGDPSALLEMEAEAKAVEAEQVLRAIHLLTASGNSDEPFDTKDERRRLLNRFLSDAPGSSTALERDGGRGSRRSRIAGAIESAEPSEPTAATSGRRATADEPHVDGDSDRPKRSRLRGHALAVSGKDGAEADERSEAKDDKARPHETGGRGGSRVRGANQGTAPRTGRARPRNPDDT